ncbi:unnamed protein product [Cercopithifilaria johnstoni]|uniref:Uncharacterized protein n=1 Tax=Cercopithifilaria johnstoni TaxID=2874296 RepID=A0A8J2LW37_9BILA|nr:unnamed protein product [Cercopithifilaria johnstoni]
MNLHQPKLLASVPKGDTKRESASTRITSLPTCIHLIKLLPSNPLENHLLHPLSNYGSRKIGRQEPVSYHQHQRIGHRHPSFIRRLSAAIPSLSTDSMPLAAVSSLLP